MGGLFSLQLFPIHLIKNYHICTTIFYYFTSIGPITVYVSDTKNEILYGHSCAKNCPTIMQLKQEAMVHSLDKPEFKHERLKIERALSMSISIYIILIFY